MHRLDLLEWVISLLMLALVVVVFAQVVLRYVTYQPLAWTEEISRYVFIWLSLLGAAAGGRRGAHFALDLLPRNLPLRLGRMLRAGIHLAEASFYGVLAWGGLQIVWVAHAHRSPTTEITMSIPYIAIPTGAMLLFVCSLRQAARELRAAFWLAP